MSATIDHRGGWAHLPMLSSDHLSTAAKQATGKIKVRPRRLEKRRQLEKTPPTETARLARYDPWPNARPTTGRSGWMVRPDCISVAPQTNVSTYQLECRSCRLPAEAALLWRLQIRRVHPVIDIPGCIGLPRSSKQIIPLGTGANLRRLGSELFGECL